jgi:hypothetical protein
MSTVLPTPPSAASQYDSRLQRELGKAAGRIRLNDLLAGALALAVLTLGYAAVAVLLDGGFELPDWARQLGLGLFAAAFCAVGYFFLVRPLRRAVNPRFAARQVERTAPDAKNVLINWVDLSDKELSDGVRAAVGADAVEVVSEADVGKATESRKMVWLGVAAGLLVALLAVLFILFKPAPFMSLVKRTFNPFSSIAIASKTELTVTDPADGNVTVTAGEPLTVAVYVGGSVPDAESAGRVRLLVRHNPAATDYDELPLEQAGGAREWAVRVPPSVVQNGFWYKVAGGDGLTPEYRVTVRSRPLFTEYEARYEYPAYTRIQPDTGHGPRLEAYKGTVVTLTAKTNRPVKRGWLQLDGQPDTVPGDVVGENKDALRFRLTLNESGTYHLGFLAADGEASTPTPAYPIRVLADRKPTIDITTPAEDTTTLPANGLLKVDAQIGDDFGIQSAVLRVKVVGSPEVVLKPKPYRPGKSFRRESDNSYPTALEYKDSVPLASLIEEKTGQPVAAKEGMTLEFWLEAKDNCTVPEPNVGQSAHKTVRLGPPETQPEKKQQLQQNEQQRRSDEKQHQRKQDQQLQTEQRQAPPPPHQDQQPQEQQPGQTPEKSNGQQQPEKSNGQQPDQTPEKSNGQQPKKNNVQQPGQTPEKNNNQQPQENPQPNNGQGDKPPMGDQPPQPNATGNNQQPKKSSDGTNGQQPDATQQPNPTPMNDAGNSATQPQNGGNESPRNDQQVQKQAEEVQKALDQQNQPGGARNQGDAQQQPSEAPADAKPSGAKQPGAEAQPKGGQPDPTNGGAAGDSKPAGNLEQPQPAQPKPQPKANGSDPAKPEQSNGATGDTPKSEPLGGGQPGQEKQPQPEPKAQPGAQPDADPGAARGAERPEPNDTPNSQGAKPEQRAGQPKGAPETNRGAERPMPQQGAGEPSPQERPGDGKGQQPTDPAAAKPQQNPGGAEKAKPSAGAQQSPATEKPEGAKPQPGTTNDANPMNGTQKPSSDPNARGTEKPAGQPGTGTGQPKVDPKEIEQAAKDLNSSDPAKQQAARDKLDKTVGKEARQQAERLMKDLKSDDAATRQAAEQKLKDLAKQASANNSRSRDAQRSETTNGQNPRSRDAQRGETAKQPTPEDIKKWAQKAQDLTSSNDAKRKEAEKDFDNAIGQKRREELQKNLEDLKSGDPEKQKAAQQKLEQMARDAAGQKQNGQSKQPSPEEMQKWAQKAQDLASNDKAKREAAEKEFDRAIGKQAREQLQKDARDLKSPDQKTRDAAKERLQQQAQKAAGGNKAQQPTKEQIEKLAEKAKDLTSNDPDKRAAAEKELDRQIGQKQREKLQKDLQDLQSNDPEKAADARKRLENKLRDQMATNQPSKEFRPGNGDSRGQKGEPLKDDPRNRLKTAQLRLNQFEKNKHNKDLLDKLKYTPEQYEKFLEEYRQRVSQLREQVEKQEKQAAQPQPSGPPTLNVNQGTNGQKLETRPDKTDTATGSAGPGTAPPGYSDAQRKFAEEAAKLRRGQGNK